MPRLARIDFPGALHHVMARGIERREIFRDDEDRLAFGEVLGHALTQSGTPCYAWAFLPNHVHLLLATGKRPLHQVLHRALARYAGYSGSRRRDLAHARALVAYWLVEELGHAGTEAARLLHVSQPVVSRHVAKLRAAPPRELLA